MLFRSCVSRLAAQFTVALIAFQLVVSMGNMQFKLVINGFLQTQDNLLCVIRHRSSRTVSTRPNTKLEDGKTEGYLCNQAGNKHYRRHLCMPNLFCRSRWKRSVMTQLAAFINFWEWKNSLDIAKECKMCIKTQRREENNPHATHKKRVCSK